MCIHKALACFHSIIIIAMSSSSSSELPAMQALIDLIEQARKEKALGKSVNLDVVIPELMSDLCDATNLDYTPMQRAYQIGRLLNQCEKAGLVKAIAVPLLNELLHDDGRRWAVFGLFGICTTFSVRKLYDVQKELAFLILGQLPCHPNARKSLDLFRRIVASLHLESRPNALLSYAVHNIQYARVAHGTASAHVVNQDRLLKWTWLLSTASPVAVTDKRVFDVNTMPFDCACVTADAFFRHERAPSSRAKFVRSARSNEKLLEYIELHYPDTQRALQDQALSAPQRALVDTVVDTTGLPVDLTSLVLSNLHTSNVHSESGEFIQSPYQRMISQHIAERHLRAPVEASDTPAQRSERRRVRLEEASASSVRAKTQGRGW